MGRLSFPLTSTPPPLLLSLLLILAVGSSLLLLVLLLDRRRRNGGGGGSTKRVRRGPLPPGNQWLPLVGETLRLVSAYKTENPDTFIDERVRRHGRLFTSHVFGERTVFSADPEVNRHVLQNEGKLYECSYPSSITTLLGRHSLLLTKGSYHKRMHSLTLSSFSNTAVLRDCLLPDIHRVVRHNLRSWADAGVVYLLDQAKKITFELAVKQLISSEAGEWTEALRREYLLLIDGFFSLPIPFFSLTTYGRALKARTKVAEALRLVVRQRREEKERIKETGGASEEEENTSKKKKRMDMLGTLLELGLKEEEEFVDFILALLVAGYETTPTGMTLAVKFLTETPTALALLREEHETILRTRKKKKTTTTEGDDCDDDEEDLPFDWSDYKSAMPFTHCVINETLRMANIISGVFRRTTTDIHIKGYTIPKGCKVFASFRAVHMDFDHYEDARTFNPWRWQQQQNQEHHVQQQSATFTSSTGASVFVPFGGGGRLCPGYELARVELAVFLHHLVTTFSRWETAEEDKLVFFPTTRTLKGYPIRVHRRRRD